MEIEETDINDLVVLKPNVYNDNRGYFIESFKKNFFKKNFLKVKFIQENECGSYFGVLRGLHFQNPPYSQAKLIRAVKGEVLDVVVDLRANSLTYGKHKSIILSGENKNQLFIPKGFAHGYVTLSKNAIISYKVDNYYYPQHESGIIYNDPNLNIDWILKKNQLILSEKDIKLKSFLDFKLKLNEK